MRNGSRRRLRRGVVSTATGPLGFADVLGKTPGREMFVAAFALDLDCAHNEVAAKWG